MTDYAKRLDELASETFDIGGVADEAISIARALLKERDELKTKCKEAMVDSAMLHELSDKAHELNQSGFLGWLMGAAGD